MGRLNSSRRGGRLPSTSLDLSTQRGLDRLASRVSERTGLKVPEKKEPFSALRKIGGILNVGAATTAGAVRGAIRPDVSVIEGAKQGFKDRETFGFADIIKEDLGIKADTKAEKFGIGVAGFAADVLFDPLTYLTFGLSSGLKVGGKTLTKGGTKLAQRATREITEEGTKKFLIGKTTQEVASKLANKRATPLVNDIIQRTFGKKGLTEGAARQFMKEGVSGHTINTLRQLGPQIIDRGGIKMFGKTLVKSSTLAKTPMGKIARSLGESEIAQVLKKTLGETFIADFNKDKRLVNIINKGSRQQKNAMEGIIASNETLFKGLDDNQMSDFFDVVFEKKKDILKKNKEIEDITLGRLNREFPELKIKDKERGAKVLSTLEDVTQKEVEVLRKQIDEKILPFFKKRQEIINKSKGLVGDAGTAVGAKVPSFRKVDELNELITGLKADLKNARKGKGSDKLASIGDKVADLGPEISGAEKAAAPFRLIASEEERLIDIIESLSKSLEKAKTSTSKVGVKGEPVKALSDVDFVTLAERKILQLQNDLTDKTEAIQALLDSRRTAKAVQKKEILNIDDFGGDQKLLDLSNKLFEGDKAIISKFAKAAGISEEDAIKFYIPSKFSDKLKVKDFSVGRNISSPSLGFQKKFTGVENDKLIRDPFEAFSRGQVEVATARVKDRTFKTVLSQLGSKVGKEGLVKVTRKGINGEKVDGFFSKEIAEELNKFLTPSLKPIDELGKATGFDAATGLFKGYVTSLFPGFHMRNIVSNQFLNMMKIGVNVGNPGLQKAGLDVALNRNLNKVLISKTGKRYTIKEIRDLVKKDSDILDASGAFGKMEQFLENSKTRFSRKKAFSKINPLNRDNAALDFGRKIGSTAESQAKMVSVVQALMEGKSVKEGIKQAEEALFNYSKITDFEKSVMRRAIPFYTFARKNLELQIKALAKTPGKVASQLKFFRGASNAIGEPITEEDLNSLPSWVLEGVGIKAGADEKGRRLFLSGFGLPIEEFLGRFSGEKGIVWNTVQNLLTQANPILKFPLEKATGQDFFRGRPITELSNAQDLDPFIKAMPKAVSEQFKKLIQFQEIPNGKSIIVNGKKVGKQSKFTANPFALHLIRNLPSSRITGTVGFLNDDEQTKIGRALRFFTGVKGWSIDKERQEFFNELDRKKELTDWLVQMGVVKEFTRAYQAK